MGIQDKITKTFGMKIKVLVNFEINKIKLYDQYKVINFQNFNTKVLKYFKIRLIIDSTYTGFFKIFKGFKIIFFI